MRCNLSPLSKLYMQTKTTLCLFACCCLSAALAACVARAVHSRMPLGMPTLVQLLHTPSPRLLETDSENESLPCLKELCFLQQQPWLRQRELSHIHSSPTAEKCCEATLREAGRVAHQLSTECYATHTLLLLTHSALLLLQGK
jgi:hypothetical protein